jgi:hypothetical protein
MITAIKSIQSFLGINKTQTQESIFIESGVLMFHLNRFKNLKNEIDEDGFCIFHIVEIFWLITDLYEVLNVTENMTEFQKELLISSRIWGRDKYGFNRAQEHEPINSSNVFIGGDLGYNTGMLPFDSLKGLHTKPIAYYAESEEQEYIARVYSRLFSEIVKQFIVSIENVRSELKPD